MTFISVAGPPFRAPPPPRLGFGYILPISATPPQEWADLFAAVDWAAVSPSLRPPYHPRLDGVRVWLASRVINDFAVLDQIVGIIKAVDEEYEAAVAEQERTNRETEEEHARRSAEQDARLATWWEAQPRPRDHD